MISITSARHYIRSTSCFERRMKLSNSNYNSTHFFVDSDDLIKSLDRNYKLVIAILKPQKNMDIICFQDLAQHIEIITFINNDIDYDYVYKAIAFSIPENKCIDKVTLKRIVKNICKYISILYFSCVKYDLEN